MQVGIILHLFLLLTKLPVDHSIAALFTTTFILCCWFMVFKRRRYHKAPEFYSVDIILTLYLALLLFMLLNQLTVFAKHSVENVNLLLRAETTATDTNDQICKRKREIEACKYVFHEFISWFVPAHHYSFNPATIKSLKYKLQSFKLRS